MTPSVFSGKIIELRVLYHELNELTNFTNLYVDV